MNRMYSNLIGLLIVIVLIGTMAWSGVGIIPLLAVLVGLIVAAICVKIIHRLYFATLLRRDGYQLHDFGDATGISNYGDTPWWEWCKSYSGTVVGTSQIKSQCHLHIRGPIFGLVRPTMLFEVDSQDAEQSGEPEPPMTRDLKS